MGKREERPADFLAMAAASLLGGALGTCAALALLLGCSAAISAGLLSEKLRVQAVIAACVLGGFFGGGFTCRRWGRRTLLAGLSAGGVFFLVLLTVGLMVYGPPELGTQVLAVALGCLCGGALSGLFCVGRKKKKRGTPNRGASR